MKKLKEFTIGLSLALVTMGLIDMLLFLVGLFCLLYLAVQWKKSIV